MKVTFSEWKIEDQLKTAEDRNAYIMAAAEEGTPDAMADAFADVFRSMGKRAEATACDGLAAYLRATGSKVAPKTARSRTAKREPARA